MFTALAHFLLSGIQFPTAGYGPVSEHLTAGITHPEKVNPSRGATLPVAPPATPADVSGRLSARHVAPDRCVSRFPASSLFAQRVLPPYDSRQSSASAGGSFTWGAGRGGYGSASRDNIHSNYDSVNEQSGIFAGRGYFDITVGNHTQLDGAVIASTAPADRNSLDTGTWAGRISITRQTIKPAIPESVYRVAQGCQPARWWPQMQ